MLHDANSDPLPETTFAARADASVEQPGSPVGDTPWLRCHDGGAQLCDATPLLMGECGNFLATPGASWTGLPPAVSARLQGAADSDADDEEQQVEVDAAAPPSQRQLPPPPPRLEGHLPPMFDAAMIAELAALPPLPPPLNPVPAAFATGALLSDDDFGDGPAAAAL